MTRRAKYRKIVKKRIIILFILSICVVSLIAIYARYVLDTNNNFYSKSKEFYFNSDKLDENGPVYQIENWSGVDDYTITINMNSNDNNLISTSYDISYDISYICSDNIICSLSKTTGVIYSSTNTDYFTLRITPNKTLSTGDRVYVQITAKAKSPYEKTLRGTFNLIVGQEKITYEIVDLANQQYLEVNITNTLSYYIVSQSFDSYNVNDKITRETYLSLTEDKKQKCYSAMVTLSFDPNVVLLDMTNNNYLNAENVTHTTKNSYNYINSITFKVDAITSTKVRFYKIDQTKNYTYPNNNNQSPVITLTST